MDEILQNRELGIEVRDINEEERSFVAYASTKTMDAYGTVILPDAFDLKRFNKNPVIPWAHDYKSPPVARSMWAKPDEKGLLFKPQFAKTAFAEEVWQLYKEDYLNAFSIGFDPLKGVADDDELYDQLREKWGIKEKPWRIFTKVGLYEISAVPVPANEDSLKLAIKNGIVKSRNLITAFEKREQENLVNQRLEDLFKNMGDSAKIIEAMSKKLDDLEQLLYNQSNKDKTPGSLVDLDIYLKNRLPQLIDGELRRLKGKV